MDYKNAGVDVNAGYEAVELIKKHAAGTMRSEVLTGIGGFAGAFSIESFKNMDHPALVSGTDGVGTKLKLAFELDRHDTVGVDCVAMCVNDIACAGADPLFFLDYIACGKNMPKKIEAIVSGVADGCRQAGAALIGGETAEMPGFYPENEYDLAGFAVGIADEKDMIDGRNINPGDVVVGIASSGVHSNGFSLIRKIFDIKKASLDRPYESLGGATLGDALLEPTIIYVNALKTVKEGGVVIKGCSHITGGGFYENVPRMLHDGVRARIRLDSFDVPPIFGMIEKDGGLSKDVMYNTFNMGMGMLLAVDERDADSAVRLIGESGQKGFIAGEIIEGRRGVELI